MLEREVSGKTAALQMAVQIGLSWNCCINGVWPEETQLSGEGEVIANILVRVAERCS